jgi:hypothetical protein
MMRTAAAPGTARVNPFATRFTRPGALPPLHADGTPLDLDALLARLESLGGSGAIEGLHGRGKTTTLLALAERAASRGMAVDCLRVRFLGDVPVVCRRVARLSPGSTLFVDGWESLGRLPCLLVRGLARLRGCRLVVTSHDPAGLPRLLECRTSPGLLATLVARLPESGDVIGAADVDEAFGEHSGNLRDALYDLYDRFERRSRP